MSDSKKDFKDTFGGSLLQTGIGFALDWASANHIAKLNYKYAEQAAENQYKRQLDFWEKQNAYNDPTAYLHRWQNAGINPLAALEGSTSAGMGQGLSNVPGNDYAKHGVMPVSPVSPSQVLMNIVSAKKLASETGFVDSQTQHEFLKMDLTRALEQGQITKNEYDQYMLTLQRMFGIREREQGLKLSESQQRYNDALTKTEDELRSYKVDNLDSATALNRQSTLLQQSQTLLVDAQTITEKERAINVARDTILKTSQIALNYAEKALIDAQTRYADALNDVMLTESSVTIYGKTFKLGDSQLKQQVKAATEQAVNAGHISSAQAGNINRYIELANRRAEVQNNLIEAQSDKVRHDDSWWNRGLNAVNDLGRTAASFIPGTSPSPRSYDNTPSPYDPSFGYGSGF